MLCYNLVAEFDPFPRRVRLPTRASSPGRTGREIDSSLKTNLNH